MMAIWIKIKMGLSHFANSQTSLPYPYAPSTKVKFTMGKWFTHVGYEVPDAYLNRNYSMDYMFSHGPFFHTGIKLDVTLNSNVGLMIGVANPTDFSSSSFAKKNFIGQVHIATTNSKVMPISITWEARICLMQPLINLIWQLWAPFPVNSVWDTMNYKDGRTG